jgi:hypothetical protein
MARGIERGRGLRGGGGGGGVWWRWMYAAMVSALLHAVFRSLTMSRSQYFLPFLVPPALLVMGAGFELVVSSALL